QMRSTRNQSDVFARFSQHGADEGADRARADHCISHCDFALNEVETMKKQSGPKVEDRESKIASLRARRSSIFDPLSSSLGDLGRHIAALDLSGGGARDRLDDVDHFWTFEIGERRAAMGDQLRFGRLARECYRRRHLFAVNPVRDAEAHCLSYRLMSKQRFI